MEVDIGVFFTEFATSVIFISERKKQMKQLGQILYLIALKYCRVKSHEQEKLSLITPARTHSRSGLKSRVLKLSFLGLKMVVKVV